MSTLPPQYNPKDVEERCYQAWESAGLFHADVKKRRTPYTIVIPPPNVTGILHMGHALNNTIQDILIRAKRMQGLNALWLPGTDHAGIATQNVVERALAKEGKKRQDLGREVFIERVWQWKEQYGNTILYQLKRLGASCDWRRTRFTMDEGLSEAVLEVFVRLYKKGLIYRGNYIINWCPRCQTALSDEEAPRVEMQGKLYHIRYPIEQVTRDTLHATRQVANPQARKPVNQFIEVATTRPETMLGDSAIAVHPKDARYKSLIGKYAILPIVNRRIPIIADGLVDREFGTGAVKVTPAHDPVDFQLGKKHELEFINVMSDDARMTNVPEAYEGLDRLDCRSKLIVDLEREGFLGAIDEHTHNVGHCYRCHSAIEPRLSPQWFVRMKPLAKEAIGAVRSGTIKFAPARWTKVYLNWMKNIDDWCISRQIWWGHRLPVYYCSSCQAQTTDYRPQTTPRRTAVVRGISSLVRRGVIVSKTPPSKCPDCGGTELRQDEDVLDTWFSSWLWPFSTLGWPKKTKELGYFYPTDVLVTAQEIIFFWVARMIMAGYFCLGKPPFRRVYIHGTVRDVTGKKMSKSLGNIIDPLEVIDKYGTDALRYTLVTATAIGQDIFLSEERFQAGRNFANKLWNATRFVLSQATHDTRHATRLEFKASTCQLSGVACHETVADRWILSRLQRTIERVTKALDQFLFNDAANTIYDFIWHDFCDWYLEIAKVQLAQSPTPKTQSRLNTASVLTHVLETSLRLLHPIMPFVTEELWQQLQKSATSDKRQAARRSPVFCSLPFGASVMVAPWPKPMKKLIDKEAESQFELFKKVVTTIREQCAEWNLSSLKAGVWLVSKDVVKRDFLNNQQALLKVLVQTSTVATMETFHLQNDVTIKLVDGVQVIIPLGGLIDVAKERARIEREVAEHTKHLQQTEARLKDRNFTDKAPADVVQGARDLKAQLEEKLKKISEHLAVLQSM